MRHTSMTHQSKVYMYGSYPIQLHDGQWMFRVNVNSPWEIIYQEDDEDTDNEEQRKFDAFIRTCEIDTYLNDDK